MLIGFLLVDPTDIAFSDVHLTVAPVVVNDLLDFLRFKQFDLLLLFVFQLALPHLLFDFDAFPFLLFFLFLP